MSDDVAVVQLLFAAVEDRDLGSLLACYSEDVEITEADALPYGGVWRGTEGAVGHAMGFMETWGELQGPEEARLNARFWGDGAGTVCALFRHRAVDAATGRRFDAAEVGIYRVREGRVVRSQMFHADTASVIAFLKDVALGHSSAG